MIPPAFHSLLGHHPYASKTLCLSAFSTTSTFSPPGLFSLSSSACSLAVAWRPLALWVAPFPAQVSTRSPAPLCACAGDEQAEAEELRRCGGLRGPVPRGAGTAGRARPPGLTPARGGAAAMGCSSSALNKAGDSSRLRSGEQGTRPHPRQGLGIRVGSLRGCHEGVTPTHCARQGSGSSLGMEVDPEPGAILPECGAALLRPRVRQSARAQMHEAGSWGQPSSWFDRRELALNS